ncbi:MAG: nitroreductase family protein [Bacteroidales bacterium]|jgi:ferredoxin|nr:nitroreductase family protein [Bacteroidales bacterium]
MAIPTSRAKEPGNITVDYERCNGCGKCVSVCSDLDLELHEGKARSSGNGVFGCIACGQCMAVCPEDAIEVHGRFLSHDDLFPLPARETAASFESLMNLLQRRRSIRKFKNIPVEHNLLDKVLKAAQTAPMGLPPSDVNVMVLDSKEKVRAFAVDFCQFLETIKWFSSSWFLTLMKPFWGKETDELFRNFLKPLLNKYITSMKKGENVVNYDAPVALYFYGSPYCDPGDPIIAATYAMIAAESLGLGTCMLGAVHPFIQSGKTARKFREKHGIRFKSREGLFLIMGYPKAEYLKGIRRNFASVN